MSMLDKYRNLYDYEVESERDRLGLAHEDVVEESKFYGKNVVLSGRFEVFNKKEISDILDNHQTNIHNQVSGNTDYLIMGEGSGKKRERAEALGVEIINEEEFLDELDRMGHKSQAVAAKHYDGFSQDTLHKLHGYVHGDTSFEDVSEAVYADKGEHVMTKDDAVQYIKDQIKENRTPQAQAINNELSQMVEYHKQYDELGVVEPDDDKRLPQGFVNAQGYDVDKFVDQYEDMALRNHYRDTGYLYTKEALDDEIINVNMIDMAYEQVTDDHSDTVSYHQGVETGRDEFKNNYADYTEEEANASLYVVDKSLAEAQREMHSMKGNRNMRYSHEAIQTRIQEAREQAEVKSLADALDDLGQSDAQQL